MQITINVETEDVKVVKEGNVSDNDFILFIFWESGNSQASE